MACQKSSLSSMSLSPIFEFADRYVDEQSALDPNLATSRGSRNWL